MTKKSQENIFQRISGAKIDDYRPVVFWSINSALNENELRRQIKDRLEENNRLQAELSECKREIFRLQNRK